MSGKGVPSVDDCLAHCKADVVFAFFGYNESFGGEAKDGAKCRVFHTTQGASEDILDDNYRRLVINGILWAAGLEKEIRADLDISFVGPYRPGTFSFGGYARQVKPSDLSGWDSRRGVDEGMRRLHPHPEQMGEPEAHARDVENPSFLRRSR